MVEFVPIVYEIVIWLFLLYSFTILGIYSWIGLYALGALNKYHHKNLFTDYNIIVSNPNAPKFSLIAPAYNEGMTIVENVRSLLSIYYNHLEIIIVNDGSKDDSIAQLIRAYQLEAVSYGITGNIETKPIRAVYKSKNAAFKKLIVVDKDNGGKADALNVGINLSSGDYIVCIDVDCILEQDSVLKLAKPFLEQTDKRVIACGGVIRLANNCTVENGKITDVTLPTSWLGRSQALEYIRAFILGRMAWSRASGLILISGAFGAFDREIVLACGGYDKNTVGEDMELVVRMRRYMEEQKQPYAVVNIPDPLCWTEVPESKEILKRQRNRWMRGTMETLWKHRKMMFNPKYGKLGMISLPYWFFFEFLGPVVEYAGYIIFILFWILGIINWQFFFALFALVVASGILYSIYAILVDLMSHQVYTKRKDLSTLITTAIIEPIYFHPIVVKAGVKGVVDYFKNQHSWGEMTRQGFNKQNQDLPFFARLWADFKDAMRQYTLPALTFLGIYFLSTVIEMVWYNHSVPSFNWLDEGIKVFLANFDFAFQAVWTIAFINFLVRYISPSKAQYLVVIAFSTILIFQFPLFLYFSETKNLLGSDAFIYTYDELIHILKTSGMLNVQNIALILILAVLIITPMIITSRKVHRYSNWALLSIIIGSVCWAFNPNRWFKMPTEFAQNTITSKWSYFFESNLDAYLEQKKSNLPEWMIPSPEITYDLDYPFLKTENTPDFLGSYLKKTKMPPNLVILIIEGLGYAYTHPKGYIGNFAPFVDSLSRKSLFWENGLSSSGRTFAALPTITGSLPFGNSGFLELDPQPKSFNLWNVLQHNRFETGFYYGGDADFDRMSSYILDQNPTYFIDEKHFEKTYRKLPKSASGESWGYEDQAVFDKMVKDLPRAPFMQVALTLSTHNPFIINDANRYEKLFDQRIKDLNLQGEQLNWAKENRKALVSVLNLDEALKEYFEKMKSSKEFKNTVFIITGDHSMPEVPFQQKIDRYHVPIIIYSPLLNTSKLFKNYVSHFDLTPSILAYYRENYQLKTPNQVTWIGDGLQATSANGYPMKQSKNQLDDYVWNKYHWAGNQLFTMGNLLQESPITGNKTPESLLKTFKEKNRIMTEKKQLLPDSLWNNFFKP